MQRIDRSTEENEPDVSRSRQSSRRNSDTTAISRKSSAKRNTQKNSNTSSCNSTPKRSVIKNDKLDFIVTGKPYLTKSSRANSMPSATRRPSSASIVTLRRRDLVEGGSRQGTDARAREGPRRAEGTERERSAISRASLEDDMSLDLSLISDFEDNQKGKPVAMATSTPKFSKQRSGSLHSQRYSSRLPDESQKDENSFDSSRRTVSHSISGLSFSQDSCRQSSEASNYRYVPNSEYSSVTPDDVTSSSSGSPRARSDVAVVSPYSRGSLTSWIDSSEDKTKMEKLNGEWSQFWAQYNNSTARVPALKNYYDQCPTPYRTENIELADLDFSVDGTRKRSPDDTKTINNIIRNEGMHLTPRETQNIIKCAHILGSVLSKAIERNCKQLEMNEEKIQEMESQNEVKPEKEIDSKKKNLSLDLKESNKPLEVKEEKKCETVTTQTDISLPNTKSAPKIFEKILRQLSKSSIDEAILAEKRREKNDDNKTEGTKEDLKDNNLLQP